MHYRNFAHVSNQPLQVEDNFKRASDFIRTAASKEAQLAVLPEYHLTSWVPDDPGFLDAASKWRTYLQRYQDLAKECNICIVPGTIVEQHTAEGIPPTKLSNVAYFIDNNGYILGRYVKNHLCKVGLLICWDLAFEEGFRELTSGGAKMIIIPTFWTLTDCSPAGLKRNPFAEAKFLDSILVSRAYENTSAIVFANAGGPSERGYAGLSQVTVPFIGALGRLGSSDEAMSLVDIDTAILDEAEDNYKIRADLASADWHYDYMRGSTKEKL
ncbi:MAG: hypothetical protein M1836_002134 [Candelina mexicana]|nr:MAG: hypothetical protein M1836_002134 [Candelina mexicana]